MVTTLQFNVFSKTNFKAPIKLLSFERNGGIMYNKEIRYIECVDTKLYDKYANNQLMRANIAIHKSMQMMATSTREIDRFHIIDLVIYKNAKHFYLEDIELGMFLKLENNLNTFSPDVSNNMQLGDFVTETAVIAMEHLQSYQIGNDHIMFYNVKQAREYALRKLGMVCPFELLAQLCEWEEHRIRDINKASLCTCMNSRNSFLHLCEAENA